MGGGSENQNETNSPTHIPFSPTTQPRTKENVGGLDVAVDVAVGVEPGQASQGVVQDRGDQLRCWESKREQFVGNFPHRGWGKGGGGGGVRG